MFTRRLKFVSYFFWATQTYRSCDETLVTALHLFIDTWHAAGRRWKVFVKTKGHEWRRLVWHVYTIWLLPLWEEKGCECRHCAAFLLERRWNVSVMDDDVPLAARPLSQRSGAGRFPVAVPVFLGILGQAWSSGGVALLWHTGSSLGWAGGRAAREGHGLSGSGCVYSCPCIHRTEGASPSYWRSWHLITTAASLPITLLSWSEQQKLLVHHLNFSISLSLAWLKRWFSKNPLSTILPFRTKFRASAKMCCVLNFFARLFCHWSYEANVAKQVKELPD